MKLHFYCVCGSRQVSALSKWDNFDLQDGVNAGPAELWQERCQECGLEWDLSITAHATRRFR